MTQHNFKKTYANHCVFVKNYKNGESIMLLLYVDCWENKTRIDALKKIEQVFCHVALGAVKNILGMKITRDCSEVIKTS